MAMPHSVFKKKSVEELKGLSGQKRMDKVIELLDRMPNYKDGPYAEVRKWLNAQKEKAFVSKKIFAREQWEVKKQGDVSFAFIGLPSVGKSSLIKAITNAQIEIAAYEFTTKKPFSATTKINGALIQLIDLPGIIFGASEGKGLGKRVLGNARNAERILLVVDSTKPAQLNVLINELLSFGFQLQKENVCVVYTKSDLLGQKSFWQNDLSLENAFPSIFVSANANTSVENFKQFLFLHSGMIRVKPFNSKDYLVLKNGAVLEDYCEKIHKEICAKFKYALVSGSSVKFSKQRVGLKHELKDLDEVELVLSH